jgi:hypothetical protein
MGTATPPSGGQKGGGSIPPNTVEPRNARFDAEDFKKRLTEEYKILQEKSDRIGSFRFTIKGWSITAVIAASAAGAKAGSFPTAFVITVGLIVMLFFFFAFELEQVRLSRLFGDRGRKLEDGFRLADDPPKVAPNLLIPVPYTAHEIVQARMQKARESWSERRRIYRQAHASFYVVLVLVTLFVFVVPYRHDIGTSWTGWSNRIRSGVTSKVFVHQQRTAAPK